MKSLLMAFALSMILSAPVLAQDSTPRTATVTTVQALAQGHEPKFAALSPDGSTIAFVEDRQLCLIDINAQATECLPLPDGYPSEVPALIWSPNSRDIAFTEDFFRYRHDTDIYTFDVATKTFRSLTGDGSHAAPLQAPKDVPLDLFPTWTPDNRLYFWRTMLTGITTQGFYRFGIDNSAEEAWDMTAQLHGEYPLPLPPVISPDGAKMAFLVLAKGTHASANGLYVLDLRSGALDWIATVHALRAGTPSWVDAAWNMPSAVGWSGSNLVVTMGTFFIDHFEPGNVVYVDMPSRRITPLFHPERYRTPQALMDAWLHGQSDDAPIFTRGVVSADGTQYLFLHRLSDDTLGLSSLNLPPDGQPDALLAVTDEISGALHPLDSTSADGTRVLMDGKLFTLVSEAL